MPIRPSRAAVVLLSPFLAACGASPPATPRVGPWLPSEVKFGRDASILLLGTCSGDEDDALCRVERVDLAHRTSIAFAAPRGWNLLMPAMAPDGRIIAVATAAQPDASGNYKSRLIEFDPAKPDAVETLARSPTEIQLPWENEFGLAFWSKKCQPNSAFCEHDPMVRFAGEATAHEFARPYGFKEIGPIFLRGRDVYATAGFPDGPDTLGIDITNPEVTNEFWQLLPGPGTGTGTRKVPQRGLSGSSGVVDSAGRLYLIGVDNDGMGLFEQTGERFSRVSDMPNAAMGGTLQSFAVSPEGRHAAMVFAFTGSDGSDETKLLLFNRKTSWRVSPLPVPKRSIRIALEAR